jgi:hypothetical protein
VLQELSLRELLRTDFFTVHAHTVLVEQFQEAILPSFKLLEALEFLELGRADCDR